VAAATGTRQYTAIFAIGAKMLASFRGVMNAASARLTKLRTQTLAFGKSILKLTGIIGLLGTAVAGLGIGELLRSLFTGATDQAKEARQRINSTIASFLQLRDIAKAGDPWKKAQDQLDIIYKQNEALGKQGVLHTDIYNEMTKQLAAGGVPPRQIKAALGPLGDLLVKTRGVNASEAEAAELAMQYVKAIHGKTKGMQAFGVFIDANKIDSQGRKVKKSYQEIFEQVLKIMSAKGIAGFNERMAATPEGKIQILRNRLQDMREEIGNRILPAQARMAEMWLKILTPENQKLLFNAVDWFMNKLSDLVDYLKNEVIPWFKSDEGRKFFKQLGDAAVWVVKNWKPLAKTIIGVVVALYALQAVTTAINFVSVLVNPVGLVVAALVILAAVIYLLITHWREFVDGVDAAYKKLGEIPIIGPALQIMMLPFKQLVHLIDWLINVDWGAVGKVISDTWNDTWEKVKHIWETAKKAIADSWAWLKKGFVKLGQSILEALLDPINKVIDGVNTMIDAVNKINPFAKIPNVPRIAFGGAGGAAGGAQAAAAVTAPAQTAAHQIPLTPEGLKSVQEERASIMQDMRRPELRNLISATLATEASGAEDQKNVLESLTNRLVSQKMAGTYKGVEDYIKNSGFYGPYKRGETQAVMAKGLSDARYNRSATSSSRSHKVATRSAVSLIRDSPTRFTARSKSSTAKTTTA